LLRGARPAVKANDEGGDIVQAENGLVDKNDSKSSTKKIDLLEKGRCKKEREQEKTSGAKRYKFGLCSDKPAHMCIRPYNIASTNKRTK